MSDRMKDKPWIAARILLASVAGLIVFVSGIWAALALWYRLPGGKAARLLGSAAWVLLVGALTLIAIVGHHWMPLGIYAALYLILLLWWLSIAPSNDRVWADDVSRPLTGTVSGNQVTLHQVRNFRWRTNSDYDARWETRHYDLDQLATTDAVLSYWGSKVIAHAMISFGFDDGRHVVFSVEIRRRLGDEYSPIAGFFKQFETILVAADERDIIRVRTNVRDEDAYLYPLRMDRAAMRDLFLSYVTAANELAERPAFYHTVTSNCTTIVYRMARHLDPQLPWDVRLLFTGYLPQYLQKIRALDPQRPLEELRRRGRITERARHSSPQDDFSRVIREGMA